MTIGRGPPGHAFLPFGASPHVVPREEMFFNPETGGWQTQSASGGSHRVGQPPLPSSPPSPSRIPRSREKAIESKAMRDIHYGDYKLDMAKEVALGILPPDWSVTSQMKDTRPNGRAQFDARFIEAPVGRARGGRSMEWTPVGTADSGSTVRAKDLDVAMLKAQEVDESGIELDVEQYRMWDAVKARDREMTDGDNPEMYLHDSFVDGQAGPAKTKLYGLRPGESVEINEDAKYVAGYGRTNNTAPKVVNAMFAGVGKAELFHGSSNEMKAVAAKPKARNNPY